MATKHIFLSMQSSNGGQTWLQPQTVAESKTGTDFPFLLASNEDIFVSWNSKKEGYRLIKVATGQSQPRSTELRF